MSFMPGDKVTVAGEVVSHHNPGGGWITVGFSGYNVLVKETDVTLVSHAVTPGQRAYEAFHQAVHSHPWDSLEQHVRTRWEQVAEAARS